MKTIINWKLYFILFFASVFSVAAVLPYAFTLAGDVLKQAPFPFPVLMAISLIQTSILFAIVTFFGLKLSKNIGLGLPFLEKYLATKKLPSDFKSVLKTSILMGVVAGITIILLDFTFTKLGVGISLWTGQMPPVWMGFLASFYGGIGEEILLRLFFMSLLIWLFSKLKKTDVGILNNNIVMWSSIMISSVIFGIGHLPATETVTPLTSLVISRAILLNGVGGVIFGWLFWKKGLESAIIAHFSTDIVLHTLFPLLLI